MPMQLRKIERSTRQKLLKHRRHIQKARQVRPLLPHPRFGLVPTYIRLTRSWLYLVAVIDWYSRYIVNWALDDTQPLCLGRVRSNSPVAASQSVRLASSRPTATVRPSGLSAMCW
jgi:transposase InsO family protein